MEEIRLQDKLGEQDFLEIIQTFYEPPNDTIKGTSDNITKTIARNYINNNKTTENLHEKIL